MLHKEHRLQLPNSGCHRNAKGDDTALYCVQLYFTRHGYKRMMDPATLLGPHCDVCLNLALWTFTLWKESILGGVKFQTTQTAIGLWFLKKNESANRKQNPASCFPFLGLVTFFGDLIKRETTRHSAPNRLIRDPKAMKHLCSGV